MTVWFTADTHFGHDAIRRLDDRPFASVAVMDEAWIAHRLATKATGGAT